MKPVFGLEIVVGFGLRCFSGQNVNAYWVFAESVPKLWFPVGSRSLVARGLLRYRNAGVSYCVIIPGQIRWSLDCCVSNLDEAY